MVKNVSYLIPRDYKHALELDKLSGNKRWYDATKMEIDQINEYQVFKDHGKAKYDPNSKWITNAPQGYQKIKLHLGFACKHDGCHKAWLVAVTKIYPCKIYWSCGSYVSCQVQLKTMQLIYTTHFYIMQIDVF